MFRFKCATCGEWHDGMPSFGADAPLYYYAIPEPDREDRCRLSTDTCVIDDEFFFIRGCIEIPVIGAVDPYVWGVWVSLSRKSFDEFVSIFDAPDRSKFGPYFGWLSNSFLVYPESQNLKTNVHIREPGSRPFIELEPTDHPLAVEQRTGITVERVSEIYAAYMHEPPVKE
ncbi:DUF2199 domain-containing protein [Microvirga calopogonii]|uniref:DUF2199 domain-containing protein n=1 Tax=Microvirga calopogonii TaxID=2078013 RepID=UPI000E0DD892|nr:DUF2199 domain-containing protein [Microvirga calopogonii]